jgi:hypothetical protein
MILMIMLEEDGGIRNLFEQRHVTAYIRKIIIVYIWLEMN